MRTNRQRPIIIQRRVIEEAAPAPQPTPISLQEKSATPTTQAQEITADENYDGLSKVTVAAVDASIDSNIVAGNIKKNETILGVTGSYEGEVDICQDLEDLRTMTENYRKTNSFARFILKHSPEKIKKALNMFNGADITGVLDLSRFDFSECDNFAKAFYNNANLTKITFTTDLQKGFTSALGTGTTTAFAHTFYGCSNLEEIENFPLHLVKNLKGLNETSSSGTTNLPAFYNCTKLKKITFQPNTIPCSTSISNITFTLLYFTEMVTDADLLAMLNTMAQNETGKTRAFKLHANVFPNISAETKAAFVAKGYELVE